MSRKRDLERLRDDEIARLMDESDSEDDLDDLNGGGGGWIDAEVIEEGGGYSFGRVEDTVICDTVICDKVIQFREDGGYSLGRVDSCMWSVTGGV